MWKILFSLLLLLTGCMNIDYCDGRHIKVWSFLKDVDTGKFGIDPNSIIIDDYHSKPNTEALEKLLLLVAAENIEENLSQNNTP